MTSDRWNVLSAWLNQWAAANEEGRAGLRAQLAVDHPELVAEAESLARASGRLGGFLETPALVLEARSIATEDPVLASGVEIGPYCVTGLLARGGTGDVYRATDTRLRRDVALKVLSHTRTSDPHRVERFIHEARLTASLDHANIVRVYDVGRTPAHTYLVAELLEGETLRARIERGPMTIDDVVRVGMEMSNGLAAAHAAGLVHRDLKPDNVFLTRSGVTKILDFGIAKLAEGEAAGDGFATMTGVVLGTAGYLAPEQIRGLHVDARADLFALGTVLFEMLTGVRAFGREHMVETLHAILHDFPSSALVERTDVPPALTGIVMRLLEKAPEDRFPSATEVISALQKVDLAARPSAPPRIAHGRRRLRWGGAAVVVAAGVALSGWNFWKPRPLTENPAALQAYLDGRAVVGRPNPDDLKTAARYFEQAVRLDPQFAEAWAGMGSAYKRMSVTGAAPPDVAFPAALEAAKRALELDSSNAEAISVQGTVALWYEWDYPRAETLLKRSISIDSTYGDSHLFLGILYSVLGRPEDAIEEVRMARRVDSNFAQARAMEGLFLYKARRYADAIQHLNIVVNEMDPNLWTAIVFRADTLLALGHFDEALKDIERVLALRPNPVTVSFKAYALAVMHRTAEAEAVLEQVPATAPFQRALVLHALGRNDAALDQLRLAVDQRATHVSGLGVDPKWDALRRSEAFRQLAKRANLLEVSDRIADRYGVK
jgi:tetratricopeptide (TPR) repeat protein